MDHSLFYEKIRGSLSSTKTTKLNPPRNFLRIRYPTGEGGANRMRLSVMVMEMMADSLTSFVEKHEKIPVHIKYSIVHDVSLGLC